MRDGFVRRHPAPGEPPDPRAQWNEIRGVWEIWNDATQHWDVAGDESGSSGREPAEVPPRDADRVELERRPLGAAYTTGLKTIRPMKVGRSWELVDVHRFPEPASSPDRRAQWNEIEGVWEIWSEETQRWVDLGEPLAPGGVIPGSDGSDDGAPYADLETDAKTVAEAEIEAETGLPRVAAGASAKVPGAADGPAAPDEGRPSPPDATSTITSGFVHGAEPPPVSDAVTDLPPSSAVGGYPQPSLRPDPRAQWDAVDGIWRVWDPERVDWVAWSP